MSEPTPESAPEATEEKPAPKADPAEAAELAPADPEDAWDPKRAKEKIRKLNQEIQATKAKLAEAPKPDDIAAKDTRIAELEPENLRLRVGYELGLPLQIALRLQGTTKEEMVEDAQTLVDMIAPSKRPATQKPTEALRGGLEPDTEPEETDTRKIAERMFS